MPKECFDGEPTSFMRLDWQSSKLRRSSRSSLNSAAQSTATAADALGQVKVFWALMADATFDSRADSTMQGASPSCLPNDAKTLYDAAKKEHVGNFEDCRTSIEVIVLKECMIGSGSSWRWCTSERQYADGLTKISASQLFVDRLQWRVTHFVYDQDFVVHREKEDLGRATGAGSPNDHLEARRHRECDDNDAGFGVDDQKTWWPTTRRLWCMTTITHARNMCPSTLTMATSARSRHGRPEICLCSA